MELVEMKDVWEEYTSWGGAPSDMPPESVFVREGEALVGGCCIYPSLGGMVVGYITTHPELTEQLESLVLRFMLSVLDGHCIVTNRFMYVDMVWAVDEKGDLTHRIDAPSGRHGIPDTTTPASEGLTSLETGDIGAAAKPALGTPEPTTDAPAKESAPKAAKKPRAKAKARKKKVSDD